MDYFLKLKLWATALLKKEATAEAFSQILLNF